MSEAAAILLAWGSNPFAIAALIILTSFVLEDVATVGSALLSAEGVISPSWALSALFAGIFVGDLMLYGLGRISRTNSHAHRYIGEQRINAGRKWLGERYVPALIAARFLPGMRVTTFTASGFLNLPFLPFLIVAALAGLVWTGTAFTLTLLYGHAALEMLGPWRWLAGALILCAAYFGPALLRDRLLQRDGHS